MGSEVRCPLLASDGSSRSFYTSGCTKRPEERVQGQRPLRRNGMGKAGERVKSRRTMSKVRRLFPQMRAYASDLSEAQWVILEPLIPPAKTGDAIPIVV
jgi:hypothetical protein